MSIRAPEVSRRAVHGEVHAVVPLALALVHLHHARVRVAGLAVRLVPALLVVLEHAVLLA
jgi:hypothetical protein